MPRAFSPHKWKACFELKVPKKWFHCKYIYFTVHFNVLQLNHNKLFNCQFLIIHHIHHVHERSLFRILTMATFDQIYSNIVKYSKK